LVDLYCDTGQPDKALDLLSKSTNVDDPAFGDKPGTSSFRQGRVYMLVGNYDYAANLWSRYSLRSLRFERSFNALSAAAALIHGELKVADNTFESIPAKISPQASWAFDLGISHLEGGDPASAAEAFTAALTLEPKFALRPIAAYYLEKLGKPVPPPPKE